MILSSAAPVGIALLLGAVFAFAFPPYGWAVPGFLALIGLAVCVQRATSAKAAFWTGYAFGAGQFSINFTWIANAFSVREGFSYGQGLAAVMALAFVVALYPAAASLAAHKLSQAKTGGRNNSWVFAFAFALCWLVSEWLRGLLFTGFPWNPVGAMWGDMLIMAQTARFFGVYGLSALTMLSASLFAGVFMRQWRGPAFAGAALLAVQAGYGAWVIPSAPQPLYEDLELVLVQANIAQTDKWNRALLADHLSDHIRLSNTGEDNPGKQRIVIWPETAYPYLIEGDKRSQKRLQAGIGAQTTLIFGANRFIDPERSSARNSVFVLQNGDITGSYDKVHLVPFGEYVPFASLLKTLGVRALVEGLSGFSKGPGVAALEPIGLPAFAPMICYEGIFPRHMFALEDQPDWILNISNDAWFGQSSGPSQHLNLVRFRAIEQGLSVVRATGTGMTAVLDPFGRVSAQLAPYQSGSLIAGLPRGLVRSPLFAVLDGWACVLLGLILALCFTFMRNQMFK